MYIYIYVYIYIYIYIYWRRCAGPPYPRKKKNKEESPVEAMLGPRTLGAALGRRILGNRRNTWAGCKTRSRKELAGTEIVSWSDLRWERVVRVFHPFILQSFQAMPRERLASAKSSNVNGWCAQTTCSCVNGWFVRTTRSHGRWSYEILRSLKL